MKPDNVKSDTTKRRRIYFILGDFEWGDGRPTRLGFYPLAPIGIGLIVWAVWRAANGQ